MFVISSIACKMCIFSSTEGPHYPSLQHPFPPTYMGQNFLGREKFPALPWNTFMDHEFSNFSSFHHTHILKETFTFNQFLHYHYGEKKFTLKKGFTLSDIFWYQLTKGPQLNKSHSTSLVCLSTSLALIPQMKRQYLIGYKSSIVAIPTGTLYVTLVCQIISTIF